MVALQRWSPYQLDINNAFFNGNLQEDIYKKQLPSFVAQREFLELVCCLHKSLYGLKQSSRA